MKYNSHSKSRRNRLIVFLLSACLSIAFMFIGFLHGVLKVPESPLPEGVRKYEQKIMLAGKQVKVDFFLPDKNCRAAVILAHGFMRNRKTMSGWAAMLADNGFMAAAPDLPYIADHLRNSQAISELMVKIQTGALPAKSNIQKTDNIALVGFSAGGFSSLLAASDSPAVSCWVGLDPVGVAPGAEKAAASLKIPAFVIRAEPSPWNANGNARKIFDSLKSDTAFSLTVRGASHTDAENPTSIAADYYCGKSEKARREIFGRYLKAALLSAVLHDEDSILTLKSAVEDKSLRDVSFRGLEAMSASNSPPSLNP